MPQCRGGARWQNVLHHEHFKQKSVRVDNTSAYKKNRDIDENLESNLEALSNRQSRANYQRKFSIQQEKSEKMRRQSEQESLAAGGENSLTKAYNARRQSMHYGNSTPRKSMTQPTPTIRPMTCIGEEDVGDREDAMIFKRAAEVRRPCTVPILSLSLKKNRVTAGFSKPPVAPVANELPVAPPVFVGAEPSAYFRRKRRAHTAVVSRARSRGELIRDGAANTNLEYRPNDKITRPRTTVGFNLNIEETQPTQHESDELASTKLLKELTSISKTRISRLSDVEKASLRYQLYNVRQMEHIQSGIMLQRRINRFMLNLDDFVLTSRAIAAGDILYTTAKSMEA